MSELHPTLSPRQRRALFLRGIELFNRGEFFDSHEAWEEIWRSTTPEPKDLFQGLIQIAAGMHHFVDRDKPGPARRVLGKGRRRLETLPADSCGLDLEALLASVRAWESWLGAPQGPRPREPKVEIRHPERVS